MTNSNPLNFANQDLRNRSFKSQNLNGADFSGCDIRGCDFSYALLQEANFERVKAGQTPRQAIALLVVAVVVAVAMGNAVSRMLFGVLGLSSVDPAWGYAIALYISLGIAGIAAAVRGMTGINSMTRRIATTVSGAASGALFGFFYAGTATGNNPQFAALGAISGALVMAIASFRVRRGLVAVVVAVAGAIAGYGFAFLVGATAIAFLSTQQLIWGLFWGILAAACIGLFLNSLTLAVKEIRSARRTSFQGADLTNAKIDPARLLNTDFSGAVGYSGSHLC